MTRFLARAVAVAALTLAAYAKGIAVPANPTGNMPGPVSDPTPPERTERSGLVPSMLSADSLVLFNFEGATEARWSVESDRVMGGRSSGAAEVAGGTLVFTGEVVTEGGGFSSVRVRRQIDLSGYDGIELRVRGEGRTFQLDVSDGTRSRGREVNRRGPFLTTSSWKTVRVPFASLEESAHGQPVNVEPLDLAAITSIGIYIIDGQDGPFRLEVDWIRAYREDE